MESVVAGEPEPTTDPTWEITRALQHGARQDPDVLRAFASIGGMLATAEEALSAPGLFEKALAAGAGWRSAPPAPGPTRDELVAAVTGAGGSR